MATMLDTVDGKIPFPDGYIWEHYLQQHAVDATKEVIAGVDPFDHGTYPSRPYYAFILADGGPVLVSDQGLRAWLTYIPKSRTWNTNDPDPQKKRFAAKFSLEFQVPDLPITGAILSLNDETTNQPSFTITGTPHGFTALPSGEPPFGEYHVSRLRQANYQQNTQTWGDIFTSKKYAFTNVMKSWDITRMDTVNFLSSGTNTALLMTPDGNTRNYTQQGEHAIIPYGWLYMPIKVDAEGDHSSLVSSNRDVMNSAAKTFGFKVSGGIDIEVGPVKESVDFSVAKNQSLNLMQRDSTSTEATRSEHKAVKLEGAYIVDKRNAVLNDRDDDGSHGGASGGFRSAITDLQRFWAIRGKALAHPDQMAAAEEKWQRVLLDFFVSWGTHYAYAATFGSKATSINSYTKNEVQQLVHKQVNLDTAWSESAKASVFGVGAHEAFESKTAAGQENEAKLASVKGGGFTKSIVVGSETDDGRMPVYLDLRPIYELFGPPFFTDELTAIVLHDEVAAAMKVYAMRPADATDTAEAIAAMELTFGGWRATWNQDLHDLHLTINGPDVIFPKGSVVPGQSVGFGRPFAAEEGGDRLGLDLVFWSPEVEGTARTSVSSSPNLPWLPGAGKALIVHDAEEFVMTVVAETNTTKDEYIGQHATIAVTVDPARRDPIKIGPLPLSISKLDGQAVSVGAIECDLTVRPVALASLLGLKQ